MNEEDLKRRTRDFAVRILRMVESLPPTQAGRIIGGQVGRCGPSVGANYRAVCRARSVADMISKLGIVEEEADECAYWMELIIDAGLLPARQVQPLQQEASELTAIMVASRRTLQVKNQKSKIENQKS